LSPPLNIDYDTESNVENTTEISPQMRSGRYVVAMGRAIAKK
ncbi:1169_t:CDS:1, partial [Dentiscutata heterogama]